MHRTSINGSYRLDRVFPGVGRLAVVSGATTREEFKKRNALLTRLYDQGRLDLLRAIAAHTYTVTEVYAADREGRLDRLSGERAILNRPLWATVETWVGRPLWGEPAEKWEGAEPWVTAAVPAPLAYKWLREYWVRARRAVGAGDVRLHDLRHFPAQLLVNPGRSEASVQSTMRHATPAMTRRYARQRDRGENAQTLAAVLLATGS
jgi:integrase